MQVDVSRSLVVQRVLCETVPQTFALLVGTKAGQWFPVSSCKIARGSYMCPLSRKPSPKNASYGLLMR